MHRINEIASLEITKKGVFQKQHQWLHLVEGTREMIVMSLAAYY